MNYTNHWVVGLVIGILSATAPVVEAQGGSPKGNGYETGYAEVVRICAELHRALDAKMRPQMLPQPVYWKDVPMPYVQPGLSNDGTRDWRAVHLSAGFIDLVNRLAHARAIDLVDRGFLKQYLAILATATDEQPLPGLPIDGVPQAWSFDVMNHQASHFNQMAGTLIAIVMAEHTLGYYDKYATQLADAQNRSVPINRFLTEGEWHKAVVLGAREALSCGFGVEGFRVLLEAIDEMPTRPAWTLYFAPDKFKSAKLRRELQKMEKNFFLAE